MSKNKKIVTNKKKEKVIKTKKSKLFTISIITSIVLLLSVTFAWFVNVIELPFFSATTGTIGFVAKGYESDGTSVGVLEHSVERNPETGEVETTNLPGPIFTVENLAAGDAVSYYLSIEKSGTLDMDYALSFSIDYDETNKDYLGGFWYRVTILNASSDGSDTALVDFSKSVDVNGNKLPLDYAPADANYSEVVKSYASYNPTHSCSEVCTKEADGSVKKHICCEYQGSNSNLSTVNRSSKFGTLTKESPRQIVRIDLGLRADSIALEYTTTKVKLFSKIYATQVGAINNPNGIGTTYYAYDVESLEEIIHNALPGDSILLSANINYYGDLIFNKAISLYTNGYTLNVYGNLMYNYSTSHSLAIDLVGGGDIGVYENGGIGGDLIIEAPNSNVEFSGVNFVSTVFIQGKFNVDVTDDPKTDGISFKGLNVCYPFNENGVAEAQNLYLDSDSKVLVNSGVKLNSIRTKSDASNIKIVNYGTIKEISLVSMSLIDEDKNLMSPQIEIDNHGTIINPIVLPHWSVPFLTNYKVGEEHYDYYGNTKVVRRWGASEMGIYDNTQIFAHKDIIDENIVEKYVVQVGNNVTGEGYPLHVRVYYRDADEDALNKGLDNPTSIESLLKYYYENELGLATSELKSAAINAIQSIEVVAVEGKYITSTDFTFFNNCASLRSIDLGLAHFENNTMSGKMYYGNSRIKNFVLPNDLERIEYHNLKSCTSLEEIKIPASVNYISNSAADLFGSCKYIYFEGSYPTFNEPNIGKYKAVFCQEAYLATFRKNLGDAKAYPMAERDGNGSGNNFVRKIDNGYELVYSDVATNVEHITAGENIRLNGEVVSITSIGSYCYANTTHEYTLSFADSVEVIQTRAFTGRKVKGVVEFNKVKEIKDYAFYNNDLITNLNFGETKIIGNYAFQKCTQLELINTGSVEIINEGAFYDCYKAVKLIMPEVKSIGYRAFHYNISLVYVEMHKVEKIDSYAFDYVSNCYEIYFYNDNFDNVSYSSLPGRAALGNVYVKLSARASFVNKYTYNNYVFPIGEKVGTYTISKNGYDFNLGEYVIYDLEDGTGNYGISVYNGQNNTNIIEGDSHRYFYIGDDVTLSEEGKEKTYHIAKVFYRAFYRININEINLVFNENVKELGEYAFSSSDTYLKKINTIDFGGVERINNYCFQNCKYLVEFNDENNIKYIGTYAFSECQSLIKIVLPNIETIYQNDSTNYWQLVFLNAESLIKLDIGPNYQGFLGRQLISNAKNLHQIYFRMEDVNEFSVKAFFEYITYHDDLRIFVPQSTFTTWDSRAGSTFKFALRELGTMVGDYYYEVDTSFADKQRVNLGQYCVSDYTTSDGISGKSLNSVNIKLKDLSKDFEIPNNIDGEDVIRIGSRCFNKFDFEKNHEIVNEETKENFNIPDTILEVAFRAFDGSTLNMLNLNNVRIVNNYAFNNCDSISGTLIADNLLTLQEGGFYDCDNIYEFYSKNLTYIGKYGFDEADNLVVLDIKEVVTIEYRAFFNCPNITSIKFGKIENIGIEAFYYSKNIFEIYFYNNDLTTYTNYEFSNYAKLHIYVKDNQISTFKSKTSTYGSKVVPLGNKVGSYIITAGNNYQLDIGEYILTEDGILSNYNKEFVNENLIIPAKVETIDVNGDKTGKITINSIYPYAFNTVTMGSQENPIELSFEHGGVTEIGAYAFNNSTTYPKVIKYIDFGDVQTIKDYAFTECYYLLRFNDDNIISTIGGGAFKNCYSLVEINLPNIVTFGTSWENSTWTTSHHTFLNARSLIKLDIGEKFSGEFVRYLVTDANNLRVFNLRINSTSQITKWDNSHLHITITNPNLKVYVYESFYSTFTSNTSFGSLVKYLGDFVEDYYVDVETPYYGVQKVNIHKYVVSEVTVNDKTGLSLDGLNYDHDSEDLENFEIPSSLTYKGEETDVINIGFRAFYKFDFTKVNPINESKENARIPDTILSIGNYAFAESKIRISKLYNVLLVGSYAFYNCDNIYIIESNCIQIANGYAFANCDKLLQVNMPTLIEAGFQTFYGCNSLLSLRTDVQTWNTSAWNSQFWPETSTLLELIYATTPGSTATKKIGENSGHIILTNSKLVSDSIRDYEKSIPVGKQVFNCYENNGEKIEGYEIELPEYYINKDGTTATIYRCLIENHTEDFYIPSALDGRPVTSLARNSFSNINFNNNQVILPSSLTNIDTIAFRNSSVGGTMNLNNVTSIGQYSFENTKIEKLIAPNLVTYTNDTVANMGSLEELIIPKLARFTANSLVGCNNLKIIRVSSLPDLPQNCANLPVNVTIIIEKTNETVNSTYASEWLNANLIGKNIDPKLNTFLVPYVDLAKYQATALKDAILKPYGEIYVTPDGLETYVLEDLGDSWNILYLITDKDSVIIPNVIEVTKEDNTKVSKVVSGIDELALNTAPSMKSITLPQSYCYYEDLTFANAISLEEIIVDGSNTHFDSLDGVLYTEGLIELVSFPTKKNVVSFTTNANTIIIDSYAFANCAFLRDVVIDTSVKVIGAYAFEDTILQTITFNSSTVPYITSSCIFDEYNQDLIVFVPEASLNIYKLNVALQDHRIEAIGTVIE